MSKFDNTSINVLGNTPFRVLVDKLRDTSLETEDFKKNVHSISRYLFYEYAKSLETKEKDLILWSGDDYKAEVIDISKIVVVPIVRAGMALDYGLGDFFPGRTSYHLGMRRDEKTYRPIVYMNKLPDSLKGYHVLLNEFMLATGGSMLDGIKMLKDIGAESITAFSVIAAPEGARRVYEEHPDVKVNIAVMDKGLDKNKFIRPGIGDAGDLYYGTVER